MVSECFICFVQCFSSFSILTVFVGEATHMADVTSASGGMMVRQVTEKNIDTARESYRPVAFRSSVWMVDVVDDGFPRRKCSSELLQLPSGDLTVHY